MTFIDCTAHLVGQLNGNGRKGMLQIDAPLSKISGYATAWTVTEMYTGLGMYCASIELHR